MKALLSFLKFVIPLLGVLVLLQLFSPNSGKEQQAVSTQDETIVSEGWGLQQDLESVERFAELKIDTYKAEPGYILYPSVGDFQVRLLDHQANVLNDWPVDAMRARLMPEDCSLLVVHGSKVGQDDKKWGALKNTIKKYSWEGEVLWEYTADERIHHDLRLTAAGNLLFPVKEMLNANLFRRYRDIPKNIKEIKSDRLIIMTPEGEEIWNWSAHEHLDLSSCGRMDCSGLHNKTGWTHLNTVSEIPENQWFDEGDTRFRPGNIMIMLRNWWQALIIDRETKEVVWSYHGDYRGGLSGGHEAIMIEKGLPGAGNILIFDNGRVNHQGESIVLEIDPTNDELVWKYEDGKKFFSQSAGAAQRLPNGNTFISQDANGYRTFEITPEGEIVWELQGVRRTSRAHKYPLDYCPKFKDLAK